MSEKTLTRMDLSEAVFREVGLSRNESADLVEPILPSPTMPTVLPLSVGPHSHSGDHVPQVPHFTA